MSDMTTIARPYAKAAFEYSLAAQQLAAWSTLLNALALAVLEPRAKDFIDNPSTTVALKCQILNSIAEKWMEGKDLQAAQNFIALLAESKRLAALPDISVQFEALRAEQEKTLKVQVVSFSPLTQEQQKSLMQSLSHRLQRQITLNVNIDKSLLGGAVIRAGDLVIDGSVRGKLNKLGTNIAA
jgi:F-type H+-transporting ATPase subunit delta